MDIFFFLLSSVLIPAFASKPFIAFNGPGVFPPGLVPAASTFQVFNGANTGDLLGEQSSCFGSFHYIHQFSAIYLFLGKRNLCIPSLVPSFPKSLP